MSDNIFGRN